MHMLASVATEQAVDLISPARAAGWLGSEASLPGEFLCGAIKLYLGSLPIPVRLVVHDGNVESLLERLADDMLASFYSEQYAILHGGFSSAQIATFRARVRHPSRRLHVGDYEGYCAWLTKRIGHMGRMTEDSPVRLLLESFLSYSQAPTPAERLKVGAYAQSKIRSSRVLGEKGSFALQQLFEHVRGAHHVLNVEKNKEYQSKDIDLLVSGLAGGIPRRKIALDAKTEKYYRNHALEDWSNLSKNGEDGRGWMRYSEMDVLVTITWPTGEAYFSCFKTVRDQVLSGRLKLEQKKGTAEGQDYESLFWLLPVEQLFESFDDSVFLSLADWLPGTFGAEFTTRSIVPARFATRKLVPQRSN
ncbi:hypothetical protein DIE18_02855 [Burkholderia sp. Bp9125]|nr:hypothetical protein DIE18_02855 [Burkholderia sp. Bp9125]